MAIRLSDIFIGKFPQTQGFGERPEYYKQFGLAGHEGVDFGTPNGTPIISATDGVVVRDIDDPKSGAYGIHCVVWDKIQSCATWYCHLQENKVNIGQVVVKGQLLGYSNNTGNSSGPHLHFNLCRTNAAGARIDTDNGYKGFINPNDGRIARWNITNPTKPTEPNAIVTPPPIVLASDQTKVDLGSLGIMEVQAIRSLITDLQKNIPVFEAKAKQLDGFISKWVEELKLPTGSNLVEIEADLAQYLPILDTKQKYRDAIEGVVGPRNGDNALLQALGDFKGDSDKAVKDLADRITELENKLTNRKVLFVLPLWKFLLKIYPNEK